MPRLNQSGADVEAWERQPGESDPAWEAFQLYRDMGAGRRGLRKVSEQLKKSGSLIGRWSGEWRWVERAQEYDIHLDREWQAEVIARRREIAAKHVTIAGALQSKAVERLRRINPEELSARDVTEILRVTAQLERDAVGAGAAQRMELTGKDGGPVQVEPAFTSLPADERLERLAELRAELDRRMAQTPTVRELESGAEE